MVIAVMALPAVLATTSAMIVATSAAASLGPASLALPSAHLLPVPVGLPGEVPVLTSTVLPLLRKPLHPLPPGVAASLIVALAEAVLPAHALLAAHDSVVLLPGLLPPAVSPAENVPLAVLVRVTASDSLRVIGPSGTSRANSVWTHESSRPVRRGNPRPSVVHRPAQIPPLACHSPLPELFAHRPHPPVAPGLEVASGRTHIESSTPAVEADPSVVPVMMLIPVVVVAHIPQV